MTKRSILKTIAVIGGVALSSVAFAGEVIDFIPNAGLDVGSGFDLASGRVRQMPFESRKTREPIGAGQEQSVKVEVCESASQLEELMNVSAGGSYGAGFFSVSAKVTYMTSNKNDAYALHCMAHATVANREIVLDEPMKLSKTATDLLAREGGLALFEKSYGDRFIFGMSTGGEYLGIYQLKTSSSEEQSALAIKMKASGPGWGARASFEDSYKSLTSTRVEQSENIIWGGLGVAAPKNMQEMVALSQRFAQVVADPAKARPTKMMLMSYDVFPEYAEAQARAGAVATMSDVMIDLGYNYYDFIVMRNTVNYVQTHTSEFRFRDAAQKATLLQTLKAKQMELDKLIAKLLRQREAIAGGTLSPSSYAELGVPTADLFGSQVILPPRYRATAGERTIAFPSVKNIRPVYVAKGSRFKKLFDGPETISTGDKEMHGNKPRIQMVAEVKTPSEGKSISVAWRVTMQEGKADWSTFDVMGATVPVIQAPPGLRFAQPYPVAGRLEGQDGEDKRKGRNWTGTGLIEKADGIISDGSGKDDGTVHVDELFFNPVTVKLLHEEDVAKEPYVLEQYSPTPPGQPAPAYAAGVAVKPAPAVRRVALAKLRAMSSQQLAGRATAQANLWFRKAVQARPALFKTSIDRVAAHRALALSGKLMVVPRKLTPGATAPKLVAPVSLAPGKATPK